MKKPETATVVAIMYFIGFVVAYGNAASYLERLGRKAAVLDAVMVACVWPLYASYRIQSNE